MCGCVVGGNAYVCLCVCWRGCVVGCACVSVCRCVSVRAGVHVCVLLIYLSESIVFVNYIFPAYLRVILSNRRSGRRRRVAASTGRRSERHVGDV